MIRMTFKNAEKNSHIYSGGRQVGGCMRLEETVCVAPIKRNIKIKYVWKNQLHGVLRRREEKGIHIK